MQTVEPFPNTVEKDGRYYWYLKSFRDKENLEKEVRRLNNYGYKTHVITTAHISALYTYPQTMYGNN